MIIVFIAISITTIIPKLYVAVSKNYSKNRPLEKSEEKICCITKQPFRLMNGCLKLN